MYTYGMQYVLHAYGKHTVCGNCIAHAATLWQTYVYNPCIASHCIHSSQTLHCICDLCCIHEAYRYMSFMLQAYPCTVHIQLLYAIYMHWACFLVALCAACMLYMHCTKMHYVLQMCISVRMSGGHEHG